MVTLVRIIIFSLENHENTGFERESDYTDLCRFKIVIRDYLWLHH